MFDSSAAGLPCGETQCLAGDLEEDRYIMRDPHEEADREFPCFIWGCPGSYWALEGFSDEEPDGYDLGHLL